MGSQETEITLPKEKNKNLEGFFLLQKPVD